MTATGAGIVGRADGAEEHFVRSCAEAEAERAIAIVGEEPVVAWFEGEGRGDADGLVARAGDLKEDFLLALVVDAARREHDAIGVDELLAGEALIIGGFLRRALFSKLGIYFGCRHAFLTPGQYCK